MNVHVPALRSQVRDLLSGGGEDRNCFAVPLSVYQLRRNDPESSYDWRINARTGWTMNVYAGRLGSQLVENHSRNQGPGKRNQSYAARAVAGRSHWRNNVSASQLSHENI